MGFFPQIWNDKTLERIKAALQEKQRIVNSVMDYTPLCLGTKANTYNGPKLTGLTLQSFPVTTPDDPTKSSISFEFDQRKGVVFNLNSIDAAQASVDMLDSLTADAADTIMDGMDTFILEEMIDGLSSTSGFKNTISDTTGHKITRVDFLAARKKLNLMKAPRRGRYCAIHPTLESDLYDIPDFISRDKIADTTAMRDGVIGRCLGFDVILADVPLVTNAWSRTAGTLAVALFYSMAAFGFGRNQELESMSAPDPKMPGDVVSLWSVYGGVMQEDTYVVGYRRDVA
jgi:hypothetical protein